MGLDAGDDKRQRRALFGLSLACFTEILYVLKASSFSGLGVRLKGSMRMRWSTRKCGR